MTRKEQIHDFMSTEEGRLVAESLKGLFQISWVREVNRRGTRFFALILRPYEQVRDMFGFDKEVAFFVSSFKSVEPRTILALEDTCNEDPFRGRVDPSIALLFANDPNLREWVAKYSSENPESRMIVPLSKEVLSRSIDDKWSFLNRVKETLFVRNLFDYKLPLKSDKYFYGREDIVASLLDNVSKRQNSGLFGLRKTGKTSVLFKVQRALRKQNEVEPIFFDCKHRPIRRQNCDSLAKKIIVELEKAFGFRPKLRIDESGDLLSTLEEAVQRIPKNKAACLIFDEVEYISPISPLDSHWQSDFIDFWQALWTIQSESEKICFIVSGVNPTVCEVDRFPSPTVSDRTVQNPMFSIFNVYFLTGFDYSNLKNMVDFFGSRMGLKFKEHALEYIHRHYGGHPLLCRLACSFHHEILLHAGVSRPVEVSLSDTRELEGERDDDLATYCEHVVSEIRELYPQEFKLLESLAAGDHSLFHEGSEQRSNIRHILSYGLVSNPESGMPAFEIPVVQQYLAAGGRIAPHGLPTSAEEKDSWIQRRLKSIAEDLELLCDELDNAEQFKFYKKVSPKLHELVLLKVCEDEVGAQSFSNELHRILVEPADKYLDKGTAKNPTFKLKLPILWNEFMRIKAYRHRLIHDEIHGDIRKQYLSCLVDDFGGADPDDVEGGWFRLQWTLLNRIHVAVQREISKL